MIYDIYDMKKLIIHKKKKYLLWNDIKHSLLLIIIKIIIIFKYQLS